MCPEELKSSIGQYDALIIRSASKVHCAHASEQSMCIILICSTVVACGLSKLHGSAGGQRRRSLMPCVHLELAAMTRCSDLNCSCHVQVTREIFEAAGGRLKVVGRAGVGVDNVDLTAATEVRRHWK